MDGRAFAASAERGDDLLGEPEDRVGPVGIAEVHHEVVHTDLMPPTDHLEEFGRLVVGRRQRMLDRDPGLDHRRITTGPGSSSEHDVPLAQPIGLDPAAAVPHVRQASGQR